MKLTERDKEILQFINAVGWCIAPQLGRRFSIKWWIVYRLMKRLVRAGLVIHHRVHFDLHGIYYLTSQGAAFTDLPPLDRISKGIYDHQRILVDVVLKLRESYPNAIWISERHLIQQKFQYGVGQLGHVADGLLKLNGKHQIAIEVELTLKSKKRLERILKSYATQIAIKEVWYFCSPGVIPTLTNLITKKPYIKIYPLKEFLS